MATFVHVSVHSWDANLRGMPSCGIDSPIGERIRKDTRGEWMERVEKGVPSRHDMIGQALRGRAGVWANACRAGSAMSGAGGHPPC